MEKIRIAPSDRVFVLTGAGISAESGLPTFRASDGLWAGHRVEDVCTPEALEQTRMGAMERFLADYDAGKAAGRYRAMDLPRLDFADGTFDLVLCSHLLFLYAEQLSEQFHIDAIGELKRVAREVRVFPVLDLNGKISSHLEPAQKRWRG